MPILSINHPAAAIAEHTAARLVAYARQTLLNPLVPMRLKATSYLRLICAAMQKAQPLAASDYQAQARLQQHCLQQLYLQHLTALIACHQQWWQHCHISSDGILWSHHTALNHILQPLGALAKQYSVSARAHRALEARLAQSSASL